MWLMEYSLYHDSVLKISKISQQCKFWFLMIKDMCLEVQWDEILSYILYG